MGQIAHRRNRGWNAAAACWILGAALLFFHGQLVSSDEMLMARLTAGIARDGSLTFPELHGRTTSPYGIIPSLLGIPWLWLQLGLERIGLWGGDQAPLLMSLSNCLLMILLSLYVAALSRRWGAGPKPAAAAAVLLALATPLFVYMQTYFSEIAAGLCLAAAAWHLGIGCPEFENISIGSLKNASSNRAASPMNGGAGKFQEDSMNKWPPGVSLCLAGFWIAAALHVRVITGALWPFWFLWAWRILRIRHHCVKDILKHFMIFLMFPAAGCAGILALNLGLRGSILNFGYETSDFTTPWAIGLTGLLFSPDRGLAFQFPLAWLLAAAWFAHFKKRASSSMFIVSIGLFWLLLHAAFWTWHGGWTPGPRFLLPVMPLFFPPFALWLGKRRTWSAGKRIAVYGLCLIGFALAAVQSLCNPLDWNNELFGFLNRTETRFLFEPHVSSWRGVWTLLGDALWGGGRLRPVWLSGAAIDLNPITKLFFPIGGVAFIVLGFFMAPSLALGDFAKSEAHIVIRWLSGPARPVTAALLAAGILLALAHAVSGPRGLEHTIVPGTKGHSPDLTTQFDRRMRWIEPNPANSPGISLIAGGIHTWRGYLDLPLDGEYTIFLKARGTYDLRIAGKSIVENQDAGKPQHLEAKTIQLAPGLYPVSIRFKPSAPGDGLLYLYWQWPGEGRILEPWDGNYLWPDIPSAANLTAAKISRRGGLTAAGIILLGFILIAKPPRRKKQ